MGCGREREKKTEWRPYLENTSISYCKDQQINGAVAGRGCGVTGRGFPMGITVIMVTTQGRERNWYSSKTKMRPGHSEREKVQRTCGKGKLR